MTHLKNTIVEIISTNTSWSNFNNKQWMLLSNLGIALRAKGVDYREHGFTQLSQMIETMTDCFELYKDYSCTPARSYVRLVNKYCPLENWAYLGLIPETLNKLSAMARPDEEIWSFNNGRPKYPNKPILWSYLRYTFCRLQYQNKIAYSLDNKYAAFNTGLVNEHYDSIIALFEKNKIQSAKSQWVFLDFVIEGSGNGKIITNYFTEKIQRATYNENPADLIYDTKLGRPQQDMDHILLRHPERLPVDFIRRHAPQDFRVLDTSLLDNTERETYSKDLSKMLRENEVVYRNICGDFNNAIKLAIKRIDWNYKNAVPMFYPRDNQICLLLPLCLVKDTKVDVALVVKKTPANKYSGATILTLDMAYTDARVVARPNSEWLDAGLIGGCSESVL